MPLPAPQTPPQRPVTDDALRSPVLACGDCGGAMVLRASRFRPFYSCTRYPACRGTHGAHPDGRPLGVPADAATRQARIDAHAAFDRVWSGGAKGARQRAYSWLAAKMGRDVVHIGEMTVAECVEVVAHCEALMAEGGEQ